MKFLLVVSAVVAVAVAGPTRFITPGIAGPAPAPPMPEFVPIGVGPAIINDFAPINIGPAIIDNPAYYQPVYSPVAIGPAPINFPVPEFSPSPNPVSIESGPGAAATDALVQIIVNVNQAGVAPTPAALPKPPKPVVDPVQIVDQAPKPPKPIVDPVQIVDQAPKPPKPEIDPVQVVDIAKPPKPEVDPIQIVDQAPIVEPIQIADAAPVAPVQPIIIGTPELPIQIVDVAPQPINIGTPVFPAPAMTLPEELN